MTTETTTPKRLTSVHDMKRLVRDLTPKDKQVDLQKLEPWDAAKAAQETEDLARKLDKELKEQFFIEELECAGNITLLTISEFPLLEEASEAIKEGISEDIEESERRGYVELRMHTFLQRTFVYQGQNQHATWAVFTCVGYFKYWEMGNKVLRLLGIKRPRYRVCPIVFVSFSDGQAEILDDTFRSSFDRPMASFGTVEGARAAYSYSMFEQVLAENEELTSEVKRLEKQLDDREHNEEKRKKEWVARIARDLRRTGEIGREGITGAIVRLFSNNAIKFIGMLLALFGLYILIAVIAFQLSGGTVVFPNPFGGGNSTITDGGGGGATPYTLPP